MEYGFGTEGYYKKMLELQDKLRKSEEERLILEEKFNEMMRLSRDAEHDRLRLMRHRYHKFLEEDKSRQERNEHILQGLDRIENHARMLAAKTQRFKAFRKQYEAYIKRIYRLKPEQFAPSQSYSPTTPNERTFVRRKLFSDVPENTETVEGKLAMLEQYLRDNFDNFPPELSSKSPVNYNRLFEEQNMARNGFFNQNNYDKLEPESEESDCNKYFGKKYNDKPEIEKILSPKKNETLGNTIEKELERLKNKEPVKQLQRENSVESKSPEKVIQDYKEFVSKSEEKFGLRGKSPVQKPTPPKENVPNIFDNATKTLNLEELKNISENDVQKTVPVQQENIDSQSENPVIKNYKQMLKTLNDDIPSNEYDLNINDAHLFPNVVKENSEHSKLDDISDRTEPPEDISLNLTSEPLPIEKIEQEKPTNLSENVDNDISLDESTIKEQLPVNLENEQKLEPSITTHDENKEIKIDSNQNNRTEIPEERSNKEPTFKEQNYNVESSPNKTTENQQIEQEYETTQQSAYPEDFNKQNIPTEVYDQQQDRPAYDSQEQPNVSEYTEIPEQKTSNKEPTFKEQNYNVESSPNETTENQQIEQEYKTTQQSAYPEDFNKQNIPTEVYDQQQYRPAYDSQEQPNVSEYTEIPEQETSNKEPTYKEQNYNVESSPQKTTENQQIDQEYKTTQQSAYPEDYNQQNIPTEVYDQQQYRSAYDSQQQPNVSKYPEGYEQQNIPDPNYPEGYDMSQQNQQSFSEGYDQNQAEYQQEYDQTQPKYVDPQYYPEQQQSDQVYDQQYTEQQPEYQEGYDSQYDASQYPPDQQSDQQYPPEQQYSSEQQQYSPEQQQYSPEQQQYSPEQQQYSPEQQQYSLEQQQYSPEQQQYSSEQQQYPSDQQYPADQQYQEYPDQQYQPGQYDRQYSQEQNSGNVYSTEHEYLQGEQNIDKQYENEQNVEYQPEQYPEGYVDNQEQQQVVQEGDKQNVNSESTEESVTQQEVDNKPIVEKKLPNLADMLDTDTSESVKQETKVSNESDFDFSKS